MAVDAPTFVLGYPEFAEAYASNPELIARCLGDALHFVDAGVWGNRYQSAVFTKTAELLAQSPFGEFARLKSDPTSSIYAVQWERMLRTLPTRMTVTGGLQQGVVGGQLELEW